MALFQEFQEGHWSRERRARQRNGQVKGLAGCYLNGSPAISRKLHWRSGASCPTVDLVHSAVPAVCFLAAPSHLFVLFSFCFVKLRSHHKGLRIIIFFPIPWWSNSFSLPLTEAMIPFSNRECCACPFPNQPNTSALPLREMLRYPFCMVGQVQS